MDIGIIGAGSVGSALGRRWGEAGHAVRYGRRDPVKPAEPATGASVDVASIAETAGRAEVIVLAVPWRAVEEVAATIEAVVQGRVVVDVTNPIVWDDGPVVAVDGSGAERLASLLPGARVVKAFNTIGAEHMLDPVFGGVAADSYFAGDDADAKALVAELAVDLGFTPVDAGPLRNARLLEHLAALWIHLATVGGLGRDIGFHLLRR